MYTHTHTHTHLCPVKREVPVPEGRSPACRRRGHTTLHAMPAWRHLTVARAPCARYWSSRASQAHQLRPTEPSVAAGASPPRHPLRRGGVPARCAPSHMPTPRASGRALGACGDRGLGARTVGMPWRHAGRQRDPRPASGAPSRAAWFDTPRRALWGYFALHVCAEDGHGGPGWSHLARLVPPVHSFGAGKPWVAARCGEGTVRELTVWGLWGGSWRQPGSVPG